MNCGRWDLHYDVDPIHLRWLFRGIWIGVRDGDAAWLAWNLDHDWSGRGHRRRGDVDVAGALGAKAGGASRKGAVGSMIGSIVGLIIGTVLIPIPLAGSAIGAIAGAIVGAIAGEKMHGREMKNSLKPAAGAAIGRILGALSKAPFALVAWSVLMWDAFT